MNTLCFWSSGVQLYVQVPCYVSSHETDSTREVSKFPIKLRQTGCSVSVHYILSADWCVFLFLHWSLMHPSTLCNSIIRGCVSDEKTMCVTV